MREKKAPCGKKMRKATNKKSARALMGAKTTSKKVRARTKQQPKGRKSY